MMRLSKEKAGGLYRVSNHAIFLDRYDMKRFISIVKWLLGATLALVLVVALINLRDEALDPAVEALLAAAPPVAVADNAYVYMQGLAVAEGGDPYRAGEMRLAALAAADRGQATAGETGESRLALPGSQEGCDAYLRNCLTAAAEDKEMRRAFLERHSAYAARCAVLERLPAWRETHLPTAIETPMANHAPLAACQRLRFARAAAALSGGDAPDALGMVLAGIEFERRALAGSVTLIGKQAALAAMGRSLLTLSDLAAASPETIRRRDKALRSALRPLSAEERSQAEVFRNEFRPFARFMLALESKKGQIRVSEHIGEHGPYTWLADTLLFSPRATINHDWRIHKAYTVLEAAPANEFDAAKARTEKTLSDLQSGLTPAALYNPVGKRLAEVAVPDYGEYFLRMHDLDALLRLAGLQVETVIAQDGKAIPGLLAQARFADPYSGKPPAFDVGKGVLSFEPRSLGKRLQGSQRMAGRQLMIPVCSSNRLC